MKQYAKFTNKIYDEIDEYLTQKYIQGNAPSIFDFAREYKYSYSSMLAWRDKKHDEYKGDIYLCATNDIRALRHSMLIEKALTKVYDPSFTKYRLGFEYGEWDRQKVDGDNKNTNLNTDIQLNEEERASIRSAFRESRGEEDSGE